MLRSLKTRVGWFLGETRATVSVETVLVFPMLAWWYVGAFVFFDAYRSYAASVRSSYVVADIVSRSRDVVQREFLDGLDGLLDRMVLTSGDPAVRVSSVRYSTTPTPRYILQWSHATGEVPQMTQAQLESMVDEWLPVMANQETVILFETVVPYTPPYNLGLDLTSYWRTADLNPGNWYNVVVTRPRFAQQLVIEGQEFPDNGDHDDGTGS